MDQSSTEQVSATSPPTLEELARRTARTLLLPYIIGYVSGQAPSPEPREMLVLVTPRTGSLTIIEGSAEIDSILRGKDGPLPASKASIDAMPVVKVAEEGSDCAICLSEFEVGGEVKKMPCGHKYHGGCIDKWLGKRGSCPICRYKMPVEEEEDNRKEGESESDEGEEDGGESPGGPAFVFHIFFGRGGSGSGSGSVSVSDRNSSSRAEATESSDEMEMDSDIDIDSDNETDSGSSSGEAMDVDDGNGS